jgi:glycosyltransferase involved in cell wall biosynthesis
VTGPDMLTTVQQPPSVWGIHDAQGPDDPRPSGCGYYRIQVPFAQLAANGWRARCQAGMPPPESGEYRIIVGERLDRAEVQGYWRRMRARQRLVYEIDDDVWHVDRTNWAAFNVYGRATVQETVSHLCAVADLVTVSTHPLAEVVRAETGQRNVAVLPNRIPASMLDITRPRRGRLTVGWTGGASHSLDVQMIAGVVRDFARHHPAAQIHVQGTDFRPTLGLLTARFTRWQPDPADYYRQIDFDIGLVPLTGSVFDAAKSAVKAMELGALGIPVIASDTEAYRGYVIDGVTGFLVSTPKQWRARLRELAADAGLRESMGAKAKEVAAQHTAEGNWQQWAHAYAPLL